MNRSLLKTLFLLGLLAATIATAALAVHYANSGMSPHGYVTRATQVLEQNGLPGRAIAWGLRRTLLREGLLSDPISRLPRDLVIELPDWRGDGANILRRDTGPGYATDGWPLSQAERAAGAVASPLRLQRVDVGSEDALIQAVNNAVPGQEIILRPGRYRLRQTLYLAQSGSMQAPLVLRGSSVGEVVLEMDGEVLLDVAGAYWTLSDLVVRGRCARQTPCRTVVQAGTGSAALTLRNLFVSGFDWLITADAENQSGIGGLIEGVTLLGGRTATPGWLGTEQSVRRIAIPPASRKLQVVCRAALDMQGCDQEQLQVALDTAGENGLVLIRQGLHQQAATIDHPGTHLLAEPGARLSGGQVEGKGALVVNANATIEGLACSDIRVGDGNGACIRQQQGDLTLIGVHIHHAEMGLLSGHKGGHIRILDSYFHDSDYRRTGHPGQNHNLYVNSGALEFIRSWSLSARNGGHELKSRAAETRIEDSLIASLNALDSRLIDIPWGGRLSVRNSVLGEGPRSENQDLIGYGLEMHTAKKSHPHNDVVLAGNTVYIDRPWGGDLLHAPPETTVKLENNLIIGTEAFWPGNRIFLNREQAGVAAYPDLSPAPAAVPAQGFR